MAEVGWPLPLVRIPNEACRPSIPFLKIDQEDFETPEELDQQLEELRKDLERPHGEPSGDHR